MKNNFALIGENENNDIDVSFILCYLVIFLFVSLYPEIDLKNTIQVHYINVDRLPLAGDTSGVDLLYTEKGKRFLDAKA